MKNLIIALYTFLAFPLFSQPILYQEKVIAHGIGQNIFPTPNGGYDFVVYYPQNGITLAKLSNQFDSLSGRGSVLNLNPVDIITSPDSGYYISGFSISNLGSRGSGGLLSPSGYAMWQAYSTSAASDGGYFRGCTLAADSAYLSVGVSNDSTGTRLLTVCRISRAGQVQWLKRLPFPYSGVDITRFGQEYLVLTAAATDGSAKILRINDQGDYMGLFSEILADSIAYYLPIGIAQLTPDRVATVCYREGGGGFITITCFDTQGNTLWSHTYQGFNVGVYNQNLRPQAMAVSSDGNIFGLSVNSFSYDGIVGHGGLNIVQLDSAGTLVWHQNFADDQALDAKSITLLPDGRILALGSGAVPNTANQFYTLLAEFGPDTTASNAPLRSDFALHLQPQPVTDILEVSLSLDQPGDLALTLIDLQGRTVLHQNREAVLGENRFSLDLGSYPAGVYVLRAVSNGRAAVQKVVKQ